MSASSISRPATRSCSRRSPPAFIVSTATAGRCQPSRTTTMYLEKFRLPGKTAIVTGAGQGIGLACAEALGEAGARIIVADRDAALAKTATAQLTGKGFQAEMAVMDVTDSARVSELADDL